MRLLCSRLLRPLTPALLMLFALAGGCSGGSNGGEPDDAGSAESDAGVDAGPPPPQCSVDLDCDDSSDCTTEICGAGGDCQYDNPTATCDRFAGVECAGDLTTDLLTVNQTICIPGFSGDLMGETLSLCQGQKCDPGDATDGCLVTLVTEGEPATEPSPNTLHISGRVTSIEGSVAFEGSIPDLSGNGGPPIALDCDVSFEVGDGLPISADLDLMELSMCGSDRAVTAASDVDLSGLGVVLSGTGLNAITCGLANLVLGSQIAPLVAQAEPAMESGLDAILNSLDCGTCDYGCPANLTCTAPDAPLPAP